MDRDRIKQMGIELTRSALFKEYEQAFYDITRLPVHFIPLGGDGPVDGITRHDSPICAHLQHDDAVCRTCSAMHERLRDRGAFSPYTARCYAGLTETAVPVRLGEEVIGYLQTGQVFLEEPDDEHLEVLTQNMLAWGVNLSEEEIRSLYEKTSVMTPKQYDGVVKMLEIFADHLSTVVNQTGLDIPEDELEPERVAKARSYINDHLHQPINLIMVAKAVNTSAFYFSRTFKKVTGFSFTDYLSMARVERAKHLMRDANMSITQIAFEAGFQSLSQFNRAFRKIQNESPRDYRKRIHDTSQEIRHQEA